MTKVIKEEFERLESLKIDDVSLTYDTSLEIFHEEFNRMSRMDDDLFTYEVEIDRVANTTCDLNGDDDLEQQIGDDEVKLTNKECSDSDEEDEVAKIFMIETNVFNFKTPTCRAFKEFNYLLQIDLDMDDGDDGYCNRGNLPGAYIVRNTLHYQDFEWYEALEDGKLKEEALKNKAIMEGIINDDEDESGNEGWRRWNIYESTNHGNEE
ncbi:hypothetical protein Tco_0375851 [Tanacetum coccineum]